MFYILELAHRFQKKILLRLQQIYSSVWRRINILTRLNFPAHECSIFLHSFSLSLNKICHGCFVIFSIQVLTCCLRFTRKYSMVLVPRRAFPRPRSVARARWRSPASCTARASAPRPPDARVTSSSACVDASGFSVYTVVSVNRVLFLPLQSVEFLLIFLN